MVSITSHTVAYHLCKDRDPSPVRKVGIKGPSVMQAGTFVSYQHLACVLSTQCDTMLRPCGRRGYRGLYLCACPSSSRTSTAAPSPITNPSRDTSKGRDALRAAMQGRTSINHRSAAV